MRPIRPLSMALAALFAVSACATPSQDPPAPEESADGFDAPPPPPEMQDPGTSEEEAMTCDAKPGQWAIGKVADDALVAKVKADTGSDRIRVIKPGMMVTMDYREDRVNLDVDAENRVLTVRCG
ncbi:MAG TPA: I78 family peptidase inhibitor [Arenimonas sp.]|nr:I78 family peptidase inhibitor [Arenimonas sp.]